MVPALFFSQLVLVALVWLCLMLQWGEQGDAGDYRSTSVQWPGSFTCHSNPEKLPYACQTSARPMQR
jgi:hypothetical protein